MILIIDTNIIFAGLLRDSVTRQILIDPPFTLYAPETALKEIRKYKEEIIKRAEFTKAEFEILFNLITDRIWVVEKEQYAHNMKEAEKRIGFEDPGDVPFLALALSMANDGIWTENARHFKNAKVKIWATKEVIRHIQTESF